MENELLDDTPMPQFPETPIQSSLSSEKIGRVIGTLSDVFKLIYLKMNLPKTNTTDRFDNNESHLKMI